MPFEAVGSGVDLKMASWSSDDTNWLYGPRKSFYNSEDDKDYMSELPIDSHYDQLLTDIDQANVAILVESPDVLPTAKTADRNSVNSRAIKFSKALFYSVLCY